VNMDEVNMDEVNMDEVNMNEVNVNAVNEESEEVVMAKPTKVPQRFDFAPKVQVEEFGMKEVKNLEDDDEEVEKSLPPSKDVKESRHANWDPGEVAKEQIEMLDVEEVAILVKDDNKVGLRLFNKVEVMQRGDVTTKVLLSAMMLCNFVRLYISEMLVLVALNVARFVIVNPMSSRAFAESFLPILSDYG